MAKDDECAIAKMNDFCALLVPQNQTEKKKTKMAFEARTKKRKSRELDTLIETYRDEHTLSETLNMNAHIKQDN